MFLVKIHLLVLVILIQTIALLNTTSALPYFPIEVSRTAECGELNQWIFPLGVLSLGLTMYLTNYLKAKYSIAWFGLLLLAWFDDKNICFYTN